MFSEELFEKAKKYIPGGVNSPVRAFKAVGGTPIFIKSAKGSKIYDVDGNEYIDYVCSWGPLILGHAHPEVISAIKKAAELGTSYGMPTEIEIQMAEIITSAFSSIDLVRMVNSGTEATMSAIRIARGYTKRSKIIKFEGCYHGHVDSLLVKAGSGAMSFGVPTSSGITEKIASDTIVLPFNDFEAVQKVISDQGEEIAACIIEPIAGNMGVVLPENGFLEHLRKLTKDYGILLIFDEVITGFRVNFSGAQKLYNITPDLTTLGKIIGGGLPVGAYGGKREIMECVAPLGDVYQAGTLSGNPITLTAGLTTLKILSSNLKIYEELERKTKLLCEELKKIAKNKGVPVYINYIASMFTLFFTESKVKDYETAKTSNTSLYAKFFHKMLKEGIYFPPSQFEATFLSAAHSDEDIEKTISKAEKVFSSL